MSVRALRRQLEELGVRPYKGWGQNFLLDPDVPVAMIATATIEPGSLVIEIGPGLGILTEALLVAGARLIAVEIDPRLAAALRERWAGHPNLTIVEGDIMRLPLSQLVPGAEPYRVIANLPYSVTAGVFRHLLSSARRPQRIVVMVQHEVGQRLVARPPEMSLLAVSVQLFGMPELVRSVPASAFWPVPKVDSVVVAMTVDEPPLSESDQPGFFRLVAAGFGQRRKTLVNSLSGASHAPRPAIASQLARAGIDPQRRAETLTIAEWLALYRARPPAEQPSDGRPDPAHPAKPVAKQEI